MSKIFDITRSKSGTPCLWEQGGGMSNTGDAQIIAGPDGLPIRPLYIRQRGQLACEQHALIPVAIGDFVVEADHHREDFNIRIFRIVGIDDEQAETEPVADFFQGEWDSPLPEYLKLAVSAATQKATCYHCREPHFIQVQA
jgi:hypothetical protein